MSAADTLQEYWAHNPVKEFTVLSEDEVRAARRVLNTIPSSTVAYHLLRAERITVGQLIEQLAAVGDAAGQAMREAEEARQELRRLNGDLAAVRRVFGTQEAHRVTTD